MTKHSTTRETQVQSPSGEDPLEMGMATHSCILAWRIPGTEEPGELHTVHGVAELERTERLNTHRCLQSAMLLCPWDSPGKNTGVDCHSLFQRIFPPQVSKILYHLSYREVHEGIINQNIIEVVFVWRR